MRFIKIKVVSSRSLLLASKIITAQEISYQ